ncbi:MAG: MBL fold metallo-hydrolase [Bacilli bacterium]|nr:MBL fold metallo-hydrolase [Bacilli bacterium]
MAKLLYQGHASFRLTTAEGKVIYIDPFAGVGYDKKADMILITHEHYDHNAVDIVNKDERTIQIRSSDALIGGVYYSFDYFGCHIQAVPAYNDHHNREECVGYLIDVEGVRLYFAGDTSTTDYMETLGKMDIDYAFLPIDGIYNMGPEEATRCAEIINPKHMVPVHSNPSMLQDMKQTMKVTYERAMLVRPNEEIDLL